MGNLTSTTAERVEPRHIFTSPGQVRNQLLQTLYRFSEPRREALRALFNSKASKDDEIDSPYWTRETFIDYLVESNADVESATRNAGPLLQKMMLHYGSFPFAINEGKRMTSEVFLSGIAMLSRMRFRVLWSNYTFRSGESVTRERRPADDVRLFFQSVSSGNLHRLHSPGQRSADDDEDLLDVLVAVMRSIFRSRNPKISYTRQDVLQAAAALPSSFSRDLQGSVSLKELRLLVELIVALSTRFSGARLPSSSATTDCLMKSFSHHLNGNTDVDWETFRNIVLGAFPNLLAILSGFIECTFQITPYFWLEPGLLPESPRIREVISQSKIISPEQLAQLLLVIPGGLALHFKDILFQETPSADHAGKIVTLLQNPGRLLLMKGSNRSQSTSNQDLTVICVYTAAPERYIRHLLAPGAWRNSCIVFSLSPAHSVYHPTRQHNTDRNLEIQKELNGISVDVQSLKMHFTDGLHHISVEIGSSTFESNIKALEIWTM